jgi:hypothetical protein
MPRVFGHAASGIRERGHMVIRPGSGQKRGADPAMPAGDELSAVLAMPGRLVSVTFRGTRIHVLADHHRAAQQARTTAQGPVTDLLHLELLTGSADAPGWLRPVALYAVMEARADPLLAVQRASRWASYGARVAVTPAERLSDQVRLEAGLRGVWLVTAAGKDRGFTVVVAGQRGPVAGSARGLFHRLLDELIWAELNRPQQAGAEARSHAI